MAKQAGSANGHTKLEEALGQMLQGQVIMQQAIASLVSNQTTLVQTQAAFTAEMAQIRREGEETRRATDAKFAEVIRILNEHTRLFERLPEAVREKIGFKAP